MKTKAERRFTKRIKKEHDQILKDSTSVDHPLHIFARDELNLILQFKGLMETFDFQYPRICRTLHDHYTACRIYARQSRIDGALEEFSRAFESDASFSSQLFDEIIRTGMIGTRERGFCRDIEKVISKMKRDDYMNSVITFTAQKNPFRSVDFWQRKWLKTLKIRKQIAPKVCTKGVLLLNYCYMVDGGDPWMQLSFPGTM